MEGTRYRVVLTGQLVSGHDLEGVTALLSRLFKQPPEAVKNIFRGRPMPLKQELEAAKAAAVRDKIIAAGAECRIEPVTSGAVEFSASPLTVKDSEEPTDEQITCPKCHHVQRPAEECSKCGVIFAKLRQVAAQEDTGPQADPVQELATFIGPNADTYLEKFAKFRGGRGFALSWHWPALFVPFLWALYRKLWVWAIVAFFAGFFWPFSNIALAATANYIYFRHTENSIRRIKGRRKVADPGLLSAEGGTSPRAVWIAIGLSVAFIVLFVSSTMKMASDLVSGGLARSGPAAEVMETPEGSETYGQLNGIALMVTMWKMSNPGVDLSALTLAQLQRELQLSDPDVSDSWGSRVQLTTHSDGFVVRSAGPDRLFETTDDLTVEH